MSKKVLFINNVRSLLLISGLLSRMGYEVDLTNSVDDGLSQLENQVYDIIVALESPGVESWTICERIRVLTDIPLIVISLNASTETCVRAINAGADYFLRKSFGPLEFLARVNSLLQRHAPQRPVSVSPDDYISSRSAV
jgi:DNA-binding response OmpR family regulator